MIFNKRLKELRKANGLTQVQMSKKCPLLTVTINGLRWTEILQIM